MLKSPQIRTIIEVGARSTTGVHNVNSAELAALEIPKFHLSEQAEIVRHIETAFARIDAMAAEATRATALLDRLEQATLTKAFRGELVSSSATASDTIEEFAVSTVEPIDDDQVQLSLLFNESTD